MVLLSEQIFLHHDNRSHLRNIPGKGLFFSQMKMGAENGTLEPMSESTSTLFGVWKDFFKVAAQCHWMDKTKFVLLPRLVLHVLGCVPFPLTRKFIPDLKKTSSAM